MNLTKLKKIELARWLALKTVSNGGYLGATEAMIKSVIDDEIELTQQEIRNELDYLEKRDLILIEKHEIKSWRATLTRHGRDLVDYQIECEPGISRPKLPPDLVGPSS